MKAQKMPQFTSEDLLQQAIAGLLQRMPAISQVQILQGPNEMGKDVLFFASGPLGERLPCSCVVKNVPITGSVSKGSGARTVLFQAQQCLDYPYTDAAGEKIKVERVYVATPYNIKPQVLQSIVGALAHQGRQVIFYDGDKLFDLFQQWWPDFFSDEAQAIESYLKEASRELESVPEILHLDRLYALDLSSVQKVYVPLRFGRRFSAYSVDPTLVSYLPSDKYLTKNRWPKDGAGELRRPYDVVHAFVKYLHAWGFWPGIKETLDTIETEVDEMVELFPSAWHDAAMTLSPRAKLTGKMPNYGPNPEMILFDADRFLQRSARIVRCLRHHSNYFSDRLRDLTEAVRAHAKGNNSAILAEFPFKGQTELARLDLCLRNAPGDFVRAVSSTAVEISAELLNRLDGSILVVGSAGSGKTSFCRWNALEDARHHAEDPMAPIPAYLPLHRLESSDGQKLADLLSIAAGRNAFMSEDDRQRVLDSESKVRLYLDGLDEVPSERHKEKIMCLVRHGLKRHPHLGVVVTARDYIAAPWLDWLPRVHLRELTKPQLRDLARQWLGSEGKVEDFEAQLEMVPSLGEIALQPLLGTLTILVFRQTGTLPDSRSRLYRMFAELLCGGWDLAKGILRHSLFSRDAKARILTEFAVIVHRKGQKVCERQVLRQAVSNVFREGTDIDMRSLERELLSDGLLCLEGEQLRFLHLSFQEYFYATYILGSPVLRELKRIIKLYGEGDDWWHDVLRFYIGLTRDPMGFADWIEGLSNDRSKELIEMAEQEARSVGLLLQPRRKRRLRS